jgi:uncharacterized hydrophobic protein (TIGR00271 family)
MPTTTAADLARMRDNLFFEDPDVGRKLSRFWILLVLASVIASAGVVGDSTATVIGAMIVAPLMTPIMGTVLAISTGDRPNLVRSLAMVVGGAVAAIAVGYLFGLIAAVPVVADTSSQVASRVHPRLIDLIAALATGVVGAFAQCREDVSDTLPGVAIAISLVPPLAVVGLTLEAGATGQAGGALLLFLTNVAAILLAGSAVMAVFRVHRLALAEQAEQLNRRNAILLVVALVLVVAVPLGGATVTVSREQQQRIEVARVARSWADDGGWRIVSVEAGTSEVIVLAAGAEPAPDPDSLRGALDEAGLSGVDVRLRLVPQEQVDLPGS